jgi:hypothetical protein
MAKSPSNTTVGDIIRFILPDGSAGKVRNWDKVSEWPPDLFAVAAALAERSGLYSERIFTEYWDSDYVLTKKWLDEVDALGREWGLSGEPPQRVRQFWQSLIAEHGNAQIADRTAAANPWKTIVFRLLTIADVACTGIGFPPEDRDEAIKYIYYADYLVWSAKRPGKYGGDVLPHIPRSLCIRVPPSVVCVQPKTNTPAVGCTLRSLTHNLALLPSIANVATHWHIVDRPHGVSDAFNILIVPFPYSIPGKSFEPLPGGFPGNSKDRAFKLNPAGWMRDTTAERFADEFLCGLLKAADAELKSVNAIVMPETALNLDFADRVAEILAKNSSLDLFITGVVAGIGSETRNNAAIYQFVKNRIVLSSFQSKHHRWGLNDDQIRRYHLGHALDPQCNWWEQIDVSFRNCYVTLFRPAATLSVLICEDLARYDPVLTVMNAIGPNLVIALLMDGPQLEKRWPGRYATVLAEDPGSAVLTVTSLGMVVRSAMPGEPQNREIALWKESDGKAKELKLPKGDHALLLSLTSRTVEQYTLDGRGDGEHTVRFGLGAAHGVRHPDPPKWLGSIP